MGSTLLSWNRTETSGELAYDYTGRDLDRPKFYAHVYLSSLSRVDQKWAWYLSDIATIAAGEEATLERAVVAAERVYATWRKSQKASCQKAS
jgi:hypothetical protein